MLGDSFDPVLRVNLSYLTNSILSQFCSPRTMLLSIFLQHRDLSPASYVCVQSCGHPWAAAVTFTLCALCQNNRGFLFAFSLCVCLQAHSMLYLCALCMFVGHCLWTDSLTSLYPGSSFLSLFLSKLAHRAKMWKPYKNHVLFMCPLEAG